MSGLGDTKDSPTGAVAECFVADVLGQRLGGGLVGCRSELGDFVVGEPHGDDVHAWVLALGASGSRAHVLRIAYTESVAEGLTGADFCVYDKSMTTSAAQATETAVEFALMIDWEDGRPAEFVPAKSAEHAARMAEGIYQGRSTWTVGREIQPWRYVKHDHGTLTDVPVLVWDENQRRSSVGASVGEDPE